MITLTILCRAFGFHVCAWPERKGYRCLCGKAWSNRWLSRGP